MIQFIDHRQLTAAYLTSDGRLLLNDEPLPDEFPVTRCLLADWDVELEIFTQTGARGGQLPPAPTAREALRAALLRAVSAPRQTVILREAKLREAADAYVNQIPIMTDASYDAEWREHKRSRVDQPWLFDMKSPQRLFPDGTILDRVGAAPLEDSGFAKVKHGNPMKSIDDVFEGDGAAQYEELLVFVRKVEAKLGNHAWPMLVQPKVDGMAVKLIYRNGLLTLGLTRGDGCLFAGTMVEFADGRVLSIDEVVTKRLAGKIRCRDLATHEDAWAGIEDYFDNGGTEDWIEIETMEGVRVTVTPGHLVFTQNRGFVRADELTVEDVLLDSTVPACN